MGIHPLIQALIDTSAGTAGGIACVYSGQPFDTAKVKMQTFPKLYNGFVSCLGQTYRAEGMWGLYRGSFPALIANIGENAMLFLCYGFCQRLVARLSHLQEGSRLSNMQMATAGSLAAGFTAIVICPLELVKCRMQAMREMHAAGKTVFTMADCTAVAVTRNVLRVDGLLGLYNGLSSTWMRDMPGYFCFFWGNEVCKTLFTPPGKTKDDLGAFPLLVSGGMAGVFLWVVVYPLDSVKSRIQVMSMSSRQPGFLAATASIIRTDGIMALYSGFTPTIIRAFPANAALFLAYELTRSSLMRRVQ
ncbi:mitochondrial ornithine transporter 1 [Petromyzon marinus]|uniref:Mitochondrial ornithine transporter 1 n=1 Tax=Petromyzon marinus TaxID=7757 RepID=A0AAJ7T951_PETMA|nr:mitochondrial ornithine transporter 1 [Petromyzon marinus]XP_032812580.1 mitochondrial ornithine transporter 1 [Petromyzon marinus]XP_032812581.1 mitochondrial ornithine transporter 1 [Petromyzon marinus]